MVLEHIEPKLVWEVFEHVLAATPRCSGHEAAVIKKSAEWLQEQAKQHNISLDMTMDAKGNLLIKKAATLGMESVPPVLLQAHIDMVCETDLPEGFDFANTPISLRIQENGEWIDAIGTTIGGDNGTGVAPAMALLVDPDPNIQHGPLEVLLTVEEETGCFGAAELNVEKLGIESRLLLNLDCSVLGLMAFGAAGMSVTTFTQKFTQLTLSPMEDFQYIQITVEGLQSGHSGVDIHLPHASANKLMARCLTAFNQGIDIFFSSWNGVCKLNVITPTANARFGIRNNDIELFKSLFEAETKDILAYYKNFSTMYEPNLKIGWKLCESVDVCSINDSKRILSTINLIPHGMLAFSPDAMSSLNEFVMKGKPFEIYELTQSSNNLARIETKEGEISILMSTRSSIIAELKTINKKLMQIAEIGGWEITQTEPDPAWKPEPTAPLLQFVKKHYKELINREPTLASIHGGLETAYIGQKIPGIQMVSIGTTVELEHTPKERINILHMAKFYDFLKVLVKDLKNM